MISKFITTKNEYSPEIFGEFKFEYYWKEGLNYEILVYDLTDDKKQELNQLYEWVEDYELAN